MKKTVCILMAILMTMGIFACTPNEDPKESSTPESSEDLASPTESSPSESEEGSTPESSEEDSTPESSTEATTPETDPPKSYLTIGGIDLASYKIVYSADNTYGQKDRAERLAAHFKSVYEVDVEVISDAEPRDNKQYEIVVGQSSHITTAIRNRAQIFSNFESNAITVSVVRVNRTLWLAFTNVYNADALVDKFIIDTTPEVAGSTLDLDYNTNDTIISVTVDEVDDLLKVMSYNVKTGSVSAERAIEVMTNITDYMPDVIGTQEINYNWITQFRTRGLFDQYTFVGKPRDKETDLSAGNEYSAIMFRTDKFNLIDSGTYWLSETPEKISQLPSCDYLRIMTFVVLERKSDGVRFLHVNTHMEWDHETVATNYLQTEILLELTDKILEKNGDMPVFITGDFNVTKDSTGYKLITSSGYEDTRYTAVSTTDEYTFSGGTKIDHCFISEGDFVASKFDVGTDKPGSDHYPVYIELLFNSKEN